VIKPIAEAAGFKFWKPIIWDKVSIGMGYHYRSRYEFVMFFEKGKRKLNDLSVPDILQAKRIRNKYPTEKPVEISEILINQSTYEGYIVADPFCGSGSVAEAAVKNGRFFWGTDSSNKAVSLTFNRIIQTSQHE
jgi:site-specific DNA-methyltransferase (adenine-specific)